MYDLKNVTKGATTAEKAYSAIDTGLNLTSIMSNIHGVKNDFFK